MKEQFATYEISLKLKELGFDECCLAVYYKDKFQLVKGFNINNVDLHVANEMDAILAPLWQQVIDWFREEYELHITITSQSQESWQWHIQFPHDSLNKLWEEDYNTYEEAREQAILKAIELIQSQTRKGE